MIVTLTVSGIMTYANQKLIFQEQQEAKLQNIAGYLGAVLQADGSGFSLYQKYFMEHCHEMDIPVALTDKEAQAAREAYEALFAAQYPGKTLGVDIGFDELSPEVQNAFAICRHERYLLLFEKAQEAFGLIYASYIVPTDEAPHMRYVLDALREGREAAPEYIDLGITVLEPLEQHRKMWEAWNTGVVPSGYDTYDNEYGKTYAWYAPLIIDGEKLGLIAAAVEISDYNHTIAMNTIRQLASVALVLLVALSLTLLLINRLVIARLKGLSEHVGRFAQSRDASIMEEIRKHIRGRDEIATLTGQTADMIVELGNYMKSLVAATEELSQTKEKAQVLSERANKDALTGIRNRNAYEDELNQLAGRLAEGNTQFGIAMVDLNYLKQTNDTYGHDQGDNAIRKCSQLICSVFSHSPVFRIGGDEFAIILENSDYRNIDGLMAEFEGALEEIARDDTLNREEKFSASIGYALYDPLRDDGVESVFQRADKAMYDQKVKMNAVRR